MSGVCGDVAHSQPRHITASYILRTKRTATVCAQINSRNRIGKKVLIKILLPLSSEVGRTKSDPPTGAMAGTSYLERSQDRLLLHLRKWSSVSQNIETILLTTNTNQPGRASMQSQNQVNKRVTCARDGTSHRFTVVFCWTKFLIFC